MGVSFDEIYYESETYLLGKEEVLRGLKVSSSRTLTAPFGPTSQTEALTARSSSALMVLRYTSRRISVPAKMRFDKHPIDKMVLCREQ